MVLTLTTACSLLVDTDMRGDEPVTGGLVSPQPSARDLGPGDIINRWLRDAATGGVDMGRGGVGGEPAGAGLGGAGPGGAEAGAEFRPCVIRAERCNGRDDDCDGRSDEDFAGLGEPCTVGVGACRVEGQLACGETEANLSCRGSALTASDERCDEVDNDCDGVIDEGVSGCCSDGSVRVCGLDLGRCTSGEQRCLDGSWSLCDGIAPEAERCDSADNDCDGLNDEGLLNACGQCGEVPIESCDGADNDCDGVIDEGVTNACGSCGSPPVELCDGRDNDCDGETDEGLLNRCQACGELPSEACNAIDDDCDGLTDEALTGEPCTVGLGACRQTGVERCQRGSFSCGVSPGAPSAEGCDGVDNDCDGQIDEGGICVELCNGLDEDDDGLVDEGVLNACGACGELPVESCDGQDNDCDGETDEGLLNACGQCGAVPVERCDGQDNDCDGETDEGVLNACGSCGAPPAELCNNQDDDCDGSVDEAFPQLGQSCSVGLGVCLRSGTNICLQDEMICYAFPGTGRPEEACSEPDTGCCDGLDNDCDGAVDEHIDFDSEIKHCGTCDNWCVGRSDRCIAGECSCGAQGICCSPVDDPMCRNFLCQVGQCRPFSFP